MDAATQIAHFLLKLNTALHHPLVTALQFQGCLPALLLGTLWFLSGWVRLQELRKLRHNNLTKTSSGVIKSKSPPPPPLLEDANQAQPQTQRQLRPRKPLQGNISISTNGDHSSDPWVTVVLPTRGYRAQSIVSWGAILRSEYNGHLEFIFVLESDKDGDYEVVHRLASSTSTYGPNREGKVIISGHASTSSQKIHNLIAGIKAANQQAAYILCFDDDVHLHPGLLSSLVHHMQSAPELRVATGYPFDIPAEHAGLLSYAALAYHLPLVIAFSLRERTHFVWGGCMLFRGDDMRSDVLGFLKSWSDGGYSDDLTVAARCTQLGLDVLCPSYAIFPQWLDADYSGRKYWNYLRRQLVVLDTYTSDHNRRTNHVMAVLHCYFSWAFVVPVLLLGARICVWVGAALVSVVAYTAKDSNTYLNAAHDSLISSLFDYNSNDQSSQLALLSAALFAVLILYTVFSLRWMTGVVCALLEALNPVDLADLNLVERFNWKKVWAGFIGANAVLPICMLYTFITRHITWAGVLYRRQGGKVVEVKHLRHR